MSDAERTRRDLIHGSIFTAFVAAVLYLLDYHQAAQAVARFSQAINCVVLLWFLVLVVRRRNRRVGLVRRQKAIMHGPGSRLEKMEKLRALSDEEQFNKRFR